jgi:hypothetical protein
MADPTPVFRFSTTPMFSGTTVRIYNTSTNWAYYVPANSTAVTLTVTALDGGAIFFGGIASFTKTYLTTDLVGDFILDITSAEMFSSSATVIPDDILKFKMDVTGATEYSYETDEVFYYNSWSTKTTAAYAAVDFIEDINSREIKYACMVNALYQGLTADIFIGNTSGIYEKFDIFARLALQQA